MAGRWLDVSIHLRNGVTVWPGDQEFKFEPASRIARGDSCNTSNISCAAHTGTHMDAPWHFIESGITLDKIDPDLFFGPAYLMDIGDADIITPDDIRRVTLPRLLIKSSNSRIDPYEPFHKDFIALQSDVAREAVSKGIRLIGIDYFSIGLYKAGREVHQILLGAGAVVIEGLRLDGLREGILKEFIVLPMPIMGADGAPCRAFVKIEES